ncbi:MAG: OsmC family protein [Solirubrobacterales bacterium]|nr:OsmC family protein [Solirubrobacterales bacterium]
MQVTARRRQGYSHEVYFDGGHCMLVDEPESEGGTNEGPSPMQVLAAALASCTAITVEMYANRKDWNLGEFHVDVEMSTEGQEPRSFEVSLRLGCDLSDEQLERLRQIAGKCPVHKALTHQIDVTIKDRVERI